MPIVRVAQKEKCLTFPVELDIPWAFACRRYGVESQGGNMMSNFYCNLDVGRRIVYRVNSAMPEPIPSAEYRFVNSFNDTEREVCIPRLYPPDMCLL